MYDNRLADQEVHLFAAEAPASESLSIDLGAGRLADGAGGGVD